MTSIEIRGADFELLRTVQDRTEVHDLLTCLENAERISNSGAPRTWTHKIHIDGSGQWLYDASTGEFTVLSMAVTPVYRVSEEDKGRLDDFLFERNSNGSR